MSISLAQYDSRLVRITDPFGDVFEGFASHNSADYTEHEFGRREDSLELLGFLFCESDIAAIEPITAFSAPYGRLEELICDDGPDAILDALDPDDPAYPVHAPRLLRCLSHRPDLAFHPSLAPLLHYP